MRLAKRVLAALAALAALVALVNAASAAKMNFFILPHSHCDPGWLTTFEGYFNQDVSMILTNVLAALRENPDRRFVWAEISYFERWYEAQSADNRNALKRLIKNGQFEFVEGGWVQADEADSNYASVINQVTEGHEYLAQNFGVRPRFAYQIDPFGHSAASPILFAAMGFEALVINRIHYETKSSLKAARGMEFVWRGSPETIGPESDIFTHVLHTHYSAPRGYDWEEGAQGVTTSTVSYMAQNLVSELRARATAYRTSNLLVPFGDDFKFKSASYQFTNMEALIKHINENFPDVHIQLATLAEYFDAVFAEAAAGKVTFPAVYKGDFFPYADNGDSYWTGYFTTRPALKQYARRTEAMLRTAEVLYTLARARAGLGGNDVWANGFESLRFARRQTGLVQHHDGVTGTARAAVVDDYTERMRQSRERIGSLSADMMARLLWTGSSGTGQPVTAPEPNALLQSPFGIIRPLNLAALRPGQVYTVVVSNPLAWHRIDTIEVLVSSAAVAVTRADGRPAEFDLLPVWQEVVEDRAGEPLRNTLEPHAEQLRVVVVLALPPLGAVTLSFSKAAAPVAVAPTTVHSSGAQRPGAGDGAGLHGIKYVDLSRGEAKSLKLETDAFRVELAEGLLATIGPGLVAAASVNAPPTVATKQRFFVYDGVNDGAYLFRTNGPASPLATGERVVRVSRGRYVQEVSTILNGDVRAVTRVFGCKHVAADIPAGVAGDAVVSVCDAVESEVSVMAGGNKEMVVRYETSIESGEVFYTDNSFELRERKRRGGPVPQNYYPSLSNALLQSKAVAFAVLSAHARGVTSLAAGELEIMLHRQLLQDDGRGLAEPNRDGSRVNMRNWLLAGLPEAVHERRRPHALAMEAPPVVFVAASALAPGQWDSGYARVFAPMATGLAPPMHLESLRARDVASDDVIVRLFHLSQRGRTGEDDDAAIVVDLQKLFPALRFRSPRFASLSADVGAAVIKPVFKTETAGDDSLWAVGAAAAGKGGVGVSQNTNEDGVFVSKAAVEREKAVAAAAAVAETATATAGAKAAQAAAVAGATPAAARRMLTVAAGDADAAHSDVALRVLPLHIETVVVSVAATTVVHEVAPTERPVEKPAERPSTKPVTGTAAGQQQPKAAGTSAAAAPTAVEPAAPAASPSPAPGLFNRLTGFFTTAPTVPHPGTQPEGAPPSKTADEDFDRHPSHTGGSKSGAAAAAAAAQGHVRSELMATGVLWIVGIAAALFVWRQLAGGGRALNDVDKHK